MTAGTHHTRRGRARYSQHWIANSLSVAGSRKFVAPITALPTHRQVTGARLTGGAPQTPQWTTRCPGGEDKGSGWGAAVPRPDGSGPGVATAARLVPRGRRIALSLAGSLVSQVATLVMKACMAARTQTDHQFGCNQVYVFTKKSGSLECI